MNLLLVQRLARDAKRDGLTLQWSITMLIERLERDQHCLERERQRDTRQGDSEAQNVRLVNEALALLILAVKNAYPAGADISVD